MNSLLQLFVSNKHKVINYFKILYLVIFITIAIGSYFIYSNNIYSLYFYKLAKLYGQIAVVIFLIVIFPGIIRRFGYTNKLISTIILFRRYLGITVYSLVFGHLFLIRILPMILSNQNFSTLMPFEIFGSLASNLMFLLFLTSNNFSTEKLGVWWKRLHRSVYLIAWLIFGHLILQDFTIWSILIGLGALLETISLVYFYLLKPAFLKT